MKKSLKAVLISALVYPGLGHFVFKKYKMGCALVICFSIPMIGLTKNILAQTNQLVIEIQEGKIPLDVSAISNALMSNNEMQTLNLFTYIMLAVWVIGILDIYRITKQPPKN